MQVGIDRSAPGRNSERRQSHRALVGGTVVLSDAHAVVGHYLLTDLSLGGCKLVGGDPLQSGQSVKLAMKFFNGERVIAAGSVTYVEVDESYQVSVGVRFTAPLDQTREHLEHLVEEDHEAHPAVLIVHPVLKRREALRRDIETLGRTAHVVASFAAALVAASNPREFFDAIILDTKTALDHVHELRRLANERWIRPIVVREHELSSQEKTELICIAHCIVPSSWTSDMLDRALGS